MSPGWRLAVACASAAACGCQAGYPKGALVAPTDDGPNLQAGTFGCLDVEAFPHAPELEGERIDFRFGNRCNQPLHMDLSNAVVRARLQARLHDEDYRPQYDEAHLPSPDQWVRYRWTHPDSLDGPRDHDPPSGGLLDANATGEDSAFYAAPWAGLGSIDSGAVTLELLELCIDLGPAVDPPATGRTICFGDGDAEAPLTYRGPGEDVADDSTTYDPSWNVAGHLDLATGFGLSLHTIPLLAVVPHNSGYVFPQQSLGTALAWSTDFTLVRLGVGRFHFDLLDFSIGEGNITQTTLEPSQVGATAGGEGLYLGVSVVAGVEALRVWRIALDLDVALGMRDLRVDNNLDSDTTFPSCVHQSKKNGPQNVCGDFDFLFGQVEPRAVLDFWVTPWGSLSPWFGVDVVPSPVGLEGGVMLTGHTRTFGEPR